MAGDTGFVFDPADWPQASCPRCGSTDRGELIAPCGSEISGRRFVHQWHGFVEEVS